MLRTPETYLGAARAQGWVNGPQPGSKDYGHADPGSLDLNQFAYGGELGRRRRVGDRLGDGATHRAHASRRAGCSWSSAPTDDPRELEVLLDGKPIADADAGERRHATPRATIDAPAPLPARRPAPRPGATRSSCASSAGIEGYAFTFG